MIIEDESKSPFPGEIPCDGMIHNSSGTYPGKVLALWLELRKKVGTIQAKQKPGMKFKTRAADELITKLREPVNELGLIIYPCSTTGSRGFVVDDGTLAAVKLDIIVQAIEDGSRIKLSGFGLGADSQDKAGGKAGTYAFKQALLQGLLANGLPDTDDTDSPIAGGVRRVKPQVKKEPFPDADMVTKMFNDSTSQVEYDNAKILLKRCTPDDIQKVLPVARAAKERLGLS